MQLTKTQVLALFLASSKAQDVTVTETELINSNCSMDTVAAGTQEYQLTTCSSATICENDAACTAANEVCGAWYETGVEQPGRFCVFNNSCGSLGKINGNAWTLQCLTADTLPETAPVPADLLTVVEGIITVDGAGTWNDVKNMNIPSLDNYQTGWWIRADNTSEVGIYAETDKPVNNICNTSAECTAEQCCSNWPDSNNKRCIASNLDGVLQTIVPFSAFTPSCIAGGGAPVPISAEDDLAAEAQAAAAQAVNDFESLVMETAKTDAEYESKTEEEKEAWDLEYAAKMVEDAAANEADRLAAGFSDMDDDSKAIYDVEFLEWLKESWEKCKVSLSTIDCKKSREIRNDIEKARQADGYYSKSTEEREAFNKAQEADAIKFKATLTAAWLDENKPAAGEEGSTCSAQNKCTGKNDLGDVHCCGTAIPSDNSLGEITGICVPHSSKSSTRTYNDALGNEYEHTCGATKLIATAGALLAAVYLM